LWTPEELILVDAYALADGSTTVHQQGVLIYGYKNRTLDPILAAGGCTLITAEPPRLPRAVVMTQ